MKRYSEVDQYDGHDNYAGRELQEDPNGDWVRYEDAERLEAIAKAARALFDNLKQVDQGHMEWLWSVRPDDMDALEEALKAASTIADVEKKGER